MSVFLGTTDLSIVLVDCRLLLSEERPWVAGIFSMQNMEDETAIGRWNIP